MDARERELVLGGVAELLVEGHQLGLVVELVRRVEEDARLQARLGPRHGGGLRFLVLSHVELARCGVRVPCGVRLGLLQQLLVEAQRLGVLPKVEVGVGQPLEVLAVIGLGLPLELEEGDGTRVVSLGQELLDIRDLLLLLVLFLLVRLRLRLVPTPRENHCASSTRNATPTAPTKLFALRIPGQGRGGHEAITPSSLGCGTERE
mmetsp:Transcript_21024/g.66609  ORF Transcript_21024/g.66609 Transcript_21024/m.66609 type:complete len:205 (-) Transcript_21024:116-730(-)